MKTTRKTTRKTTLSAARAGLILLVAGFGALSYSGASPSSKLMGAWKLKSVGGKDPSSINIKSWQIEFRAQGKFVYSGSMAGEFEGTQVSGSGTWTLAGNQLDYTAGDNKGKATVHLDSNSLTFSPDPVLRLHGN